MLLPIDVVIHHLLPWLWAKEAYTGIVQAMPELEWMVESKCKHIEPHGLIQERGWITRTIDALLRVDKLGHVLTAIKSRYPNQNEWITQSLFREGQWHRDTCPAFYLSNEDLVFECWIENNAVIRCKVSHAGKEVSLKHYRYSDDRINTQRWEKDKRTVLVVRRTTRVGEPGNSVMLSFESVQRFPVPIPAPPESIFTFPLVEPARPLRMVFHGEHD